MWLFAAFVSALIFAAIAAATFVPLQTPAGVDYLLVAPTIVQLVLSCAAVLTLILLVLVVIAAAKRFSSASPAGAISVRWLTPLVLLAFVAVGLLPARVGELGAVAGYFFYDLRWWWLAVVLGLVLVRANSFRWVEGEERRLGAVAAWSATLFATVTIASVASTPHLRFSAQLDGDEPKYIRLAETLYQGVGLDISSKVRFADRRSDDRPHFVDDLVLIERAIADDARAFVTDMRAFSANPRAFRWNRVAAAEGFVTGKRGGVYEIHQPGVSILLLPGYVIDRYWIAREATYNGEFPGKLPMTNLAMLLIYGACGLSLFRLLGHALKSRALAAFWSSVAMLTLPIGAFAFQLYPELPAALIVVAITDYVFFAAKRSGAAACAAGAGAAFLIWLHPRFLAVSACLALFALRRLSQPDRDQRRAFVFGYGTVLLSVMAFDYHVTGSWLPTALWDATGEGITLSSGLLLNLAGYAFDRSWGLIPHSLILMFAVPGLVVLARDSIERAVFIAVAVLALAIPSAGHTLSAAGTTPGRLLVAVAPLLIWPVAMFVRHYWSSRVVRVLAVCFVVISLETAFSYNWNHRKGVGLLRTAGASGWRPNLAFPVVRGDAWNKSSANFAVFIAWSLLVAGTALVAFRRSDGSSAQIAVRSSGVRGATGVTSVLLILFTTATAAGGDWTGDRFMPGFAEAQQRAARALVVRDRCEFCFSSRRGRIAWTTLEPNPANDANVAVERDGQRVRVNVTLCGGRDDRGFARARLDFGDEAGTPWTGIVGLRSFEHEYRRSGHYAVLVSVRFRNGEVRQYRQPIDVP